MSGALDESWRDVLDAVAQRERLPTSRDVQKLAPLLARLSSAYNDRERAPDVDDRGSLAARLHFSFVRDVPKASAALREVAPLVPRDRAVRVLDIGAGLGAMTWGVARALGPGAVVEADLTDRHGAALEIAAAIAKERAGRGSGEVRVKTRVAAVDALGRGMGTYDVVIAGQVLSELDRDLAETDRVARHLDYVERWLAHVKTDGTLVIVEPALRDRTRHLQRVRDDIVMRKVATVFAPCLHDAPCPMLARESDWCHEDVPVDLPEWLVPLARSASLRYERLTFSYLVLRKDGASLGARLAGASVLRDVSGLLRTKGKTERMLCGRTPGFVGGLRATRLDRHESDANAPWSEAQRGDILSFDPPLAPERPRVEGAVALVPTGIDVTDTAR